MTIYKNGVQARIGKEEMEITADKLLKGAGAGADPVEIDVPAVGVPPATVGDIEEATADTERTTTSTTYVKIKEIRIGRYGNYRISFYLNTTTGHDSYGQIYRNGAAIGTERHVTSSTKFTEDIADWSPGDLCQLYLHTTAGNTGSATEFRLMSSCRITPQVITD